jgi:hypothetical protein
MIRTQYLFIIAKHITIFISLFIFDCVPIDTVATPLTTAAARNWFLGSGFGISVAASPTYAQMHNVIDTQIVNLTKSACIYN